MQDLNRIGYASVEEFPLKIYFVGARGDWKFKGYATGHHEYNAEKCCDSCEVGMSATPYMSDLRITPSWLPTIKIPQLECALTNILGWHSQAFFADPTHTLYLGCGRDLIGTLLVVIAKVAHPEQCLDVALSEMILEIRSWCSERGLPFTCQSLCKADLSIEDEANDFPHFKGKAYDCKVLCLFVADKLAKMPEHLAEYLCAHELARWIQEASDVFSRTCLDLVLLKFKMWFRDASV